MVPWRTRAFICVFLRDAFWDQEDGMCDLLAGKAQASNDILDPRARGECLKTVSIEKRGTNQLELLIAGSVL